MDNADLDQFEDVRLKKAVVRAWGGEKAPAGLSDRIRASLEEESAPAPYRMDRWSARVSPRAWGGMALAASVLLIIGLSTFQFMPVAVTQSSNAVLASGIPVSLIHDVITTHDRCCGKTSGGHHTLDCAESDLPAIRAILEERLGCPVWVVMPDGWEFAGADDCRVGDGPEKCAHLLFNRQNRKQTLSVISVAYDGPSTLKAGEAFAEEVERHPVAGFVDGGAMHCMVGYSEDGSLTVAELKSATQAYRQTILTHADSSARLTNLTFPTASARR